MKRRLGTGWTNDGVLLGAISIDAIRWMPEDITPCDHKPNLRVLEVHEPGLAKSEGVLIVEERD